jgi:hypothetical protein
VEGGLVNTLRRIWNGFFFQGFSVQSLGLLRICFGVGLFFFHITQFFNLLTLEPTGTRFFFYETMWHFDLLGIEWHVPWLSYAFFALLMASTATMALGMHTRTSIGLVILCIFYLKGVRDSLTGDVHHRYLVPVQILLLLLLSKCGHAYSWDERRRAVKSRVEEWQASWPIKAMQVYTVFFYFWGGIAKLRVSGWGWVSDGTRIQELLMARSIMWGVEPGGDPVANPLAWWLAHQPELCFLLGVATLVMELGFPLLLLVRNDRLRLLILLGVTFFHVMNFVLAYVGFALFPIVFFIFFDLEKVKRWFQARSGLGPQLAPG